MQRAPAGQVGLILATALLVVLGMVPVARSFLHSSFVGGLVATPGHRRRTHDEGGQVDDCEVSLEHAPESSWLPGWSA